VGFERLAEDLRELLAPEDLVQRALECAVEEVHHACMTMDLAERLGATVELPPIPSAVLRTPHEIAVDNAHGGCVRTTYAAILAHYQAQCANDETIACTMQVIAEVVTRQATLAWDVARWLELRLTADERRDVDVVRGKAFRRLRFELLDEPDTELVMTAGLPASARALALLEGFETHLITAA
jgi:hypothetical protein